MSDGSIVIVVTIGLSLSNEAGMVHLEEILYNVHENHEKLLLKGRPRRDYGVPQEPNQMGEVVDGRCATAAVVITVTTFETAY